MTQGATITLAPNGQTARANRARSQAPVLRRLPVAVRAGLMPWVPFWMSLGIGGWFWLPFEPGLMMYAACGLIACGALAICLFAPRAAERGWLAWPHVDALRLLGFSILIIAIGFGLAGFRSWSVAAPIMPYRYYGPVEGRVIEIDRSSSDRMRLTLDQVVLDDVSPEKMPVRIRISLFDSANLPVPGQRVMLTANLGPPNGPSEPGGFDFRRMAWFERLGAVGYSRSPVLTVEPPAAGGALALHRLRMQLADAMRARIGGQEGGVAAALMTGDRSGISEHTNDVMRASNLYHIISISGLHMSMLAGFVYAGLRLLGVVFQGITRTGSGGRTHKMAAGGALVAAAIYLWLSGGGVATDRAFLMVAVMLLAIIADRRAISLRTVAVAAILILMMSPDALTSAGFQMSFAATVALILSQGPWLKVSPYLPGWSKPIAMLFVSSLVASLATSPIAAAHFGRMTQYGMLANLLVVPVVGAVVMPAGVIAGLLAPLGLAGPALWAMGLGVKWMLVVAEWISNLGGAVSYVPSPPWSVVPLLGVGACLALLAPVGASFGQLKTVPYRRLVGVALMVAAGFLWMAEKRPLMLISAEGDAAAIVGPDGRVPSKQKGGSFAVKEWLESDGDPIDQERAADRPMWTGKTDARIARLDTPDGPREIVHLTGKRAIEIAAQYCKAGSILVVNKNVSAGFDKHAGCVVFDPSTLRNTGAIALGYHGSGFLITSTQAASGNRPWSNSTARTKHVALSGSI